MFSKFQVGLPPRNFCQSSRGGSVTIFSLIKRRIFSCFRVPREMVTEDPSSPWHHSGMSSQQSSMMKTRGTYNLLMLRSFLLSQTNRRAQRSTSGLLPLALAAFSCSPSCFSFCSKKSSFLCPSPSLACLPLLKLGISHPSLWISPRTTQW